MCGGLLPHSLGHFYFGCDTGLSAPIPSEAAERFKIPHRRAMHGGR
jgi:hypothetical protein